MKTSAFLVSYQKYHYENCFKDQLIYAKNHGFDAVEPGYGHELSGPNGAENAKSVKAEMDRLGLECSCYSHAISLINADKKELLKMLRYSVDMCSVLGSPYLHHTFQTNMNKKHLSLYNAHKKEFVEFAREVAYYAGEKGVDCIYEDQGYLINTPERMCELLYEINLSNTGICLDVGNSLAYDIQPEAFAGILAPFIKHVHLKDHIIKPVNQVRLAKGWYTSIGGNAIRDTIIGHGVINFEKIFTILLEAGYDGYFSLEYAAPEETLYGIEQSLKNMKLFYDKAKYNLDCQKGIK